jgi:RNA polymerase sigma-70 factor (ECF subfamily)
MSIASDAGKLSASVARALAEARAAWPAVEVPDDVFAAYLLARSDGSDVDAMHAADLYLACACSRGDARALAAFDSAFLAPVTAIVTRAGAPPHVGGDVAQTLREQLLVRDGPRPPRIAEYAGRGSLAGWIRVVAVRAANGLRRIERGHASVEPPEARPPESPEDATIRARYGDAFERAFRDAFRALPPEDRLILRLHFAEGLNLDRLAVALGFSRATAGRRIQSARARLREETMRLLESSLKAPRPEIESVLAALRSRLEVSLSALVTAA